MKKIFLTVVITLLVIIGVFLIYIYSGIYNMSQMSTHSGITHWAINTTMQHSVSARSKKIKVPVMNDSSMLIEGFTHYNEMCSTCHGGPGVQPDELAKGLYPKPPEFYKSKDLPDTAEAFWIIKNGIKYTSMPAFGPTHSDEKIWAITDFLLNELPKMSPRKYQLWKNQYAEMEEN